MTRLIITNGKLILPDRIETDKALICKDGKIEQIVSEEALELLPDDQIMDAGQQYVSPGFIDMHIHGGGGHDFMDGTTEAFLGIAETHAQYGTTAMVPTTLTSTNDDLMNIFATYQKAKVLNTRGAKFIGLQDLISLPVNVEHKTHNTLKSHGRKNITLSWRLQKI